MLTQMIIQSYKNETLVETLHFTSNNVQLHEINAFEGARFTLLNYTQSHSPHLIYVHRFKDDLYIDLLSYDVLTDNAVIRHFFSKKGCSLTGQTKDGALHAYIAENAEHGCAVDQLQDMQSSFQKLDNSYYVAPQQPASWLERLLNCMPLKRHAA